ncbi:MAG: hypothetical protein L3J15_03825 [Devosiaceae bacterium]|nr:hypothetical protein [Devosiaceae bacterium]
MHNTILEKWQYKAKKNSKNIVIPDGCRDILFWASKGQTPRCTITSLDEKSYFAAINAGDYLQGFRLKAGTIIKQQQLFSSLKGLECEHEHRNF